MDRERFALLAQRIVDVGSGETVRHELFLRMVDEDQLIPAREFVSAAEEAGSIREIDQWATRQAIDIAASGRPIHLNVSMRSVDGELLDLIRERLEATDADPGDLVFELSEKQLGEAGEEEAGFVRAVSELGCALAVDDFVGEGHSTLLQAFPLSYVKLAPELLRGIAADPASRSKAEVIVLAGHRLGLGIIAHGVEDLVTLDALADLGVDEAQGHVFGPAEPVGELLASTA
jgi:EAL domain-containing protein (putative c-di-GMP-specific phosphodiesterase class I)